MIFSKRMKGFESFPQMVRCHLLSVGWGFTALFALGPLGHLERAYPAAFTYLGWLFSGTALTAWFAVAAGPMCWWVAKVIAGARKPAFAWRYSKAQTLRIYAAFLTPVMPAMAWHLTHPFFLKYRLLHLESAVEEWTLFVYGLALLVGARRITTNFIFWFPNDGDIPRGER